MLTKSKKICIGILVGILICFISLFITIGVKTQRQQKASIAASESASIAESESISVEESIRVSEEQSIAESEKASKEEQKKLDNYAHDLEYVINLMYENYCKSEKYGNLIVNVWQNAIYQDEDPETDRYTKPNGVFVDDFNDALSNLFNDDNYGTELLNIWLNGEKVKVAMRSLNDVPEQYEKEYAVVNEFYQVYNNFINLVQNPIGSLLTFSENYHKAQYDILNVLAKVRLYFPDV